MKAFWNDCGRGVDAESPVEVDLATAGLIWSDEVRGVKGNFLGLVDDRGNVIQFYFDEEIPDHIEDAGHLEIVLLDFPQPQMRGSYAARIAIGRVHDLIEKAFRDGADFRKYDGLRFMSWSA